MDREELLSIAKILVKERYVLEEKLINIEQLTLEDKNELYESFQNNFDLMRSVENELKNMEVQNWWEFIEQCTKELIKLKKQ